MVALSDSLNLNETLTSIDLSSNKIGFLLTSLQIYYLNHLQILGNVGATSLAKLTSSNPTLTGGSSIEYA